MVIWIIETAYILLSLGLIGAAIAFALQDIFIWYELTIPITYDSEWRETNKVILEIIKTETREIVEKAERTMTELEEKYYFQKRAIEPSIFLTLTDNWISFGIRYVTEVLNRRVCMTT
jgi:small-conductance mechanosensitive channel